MDSIYDNFKTTLTWLGLIFLILLFVGGVLVFNTGKVLVKHTVDEKQTYDVLVIFMGEPLPRTRAALKLYRQGLAPKIAFSRTLSSEAHREGFYLKDGDTTFQYLLRNRVPKEDILFDKSKANSSTLQEAQAITEFLNSQKSPFKSWLVVTSWYHSARVAWSLEKFKHPPETRIDYFAAKQGTNGPDNWWQAEKSVLAVYTEYLKWLYYLINY